MVFLALGGRNGIDGCRPTEALVLAYYGCCRVLRNHETAVETGIGYQELWQSSLAGDKAENPSFGNVGKL